MDYESAHCRARRIQNESLWNRNGLRKILYADAADQEIVKMMPNIIKSSSLNAFNVSSVIKQRLEELTGQIQYGRSEKRAVGITQQRFDIHHLNQYE